MARIRTPICDTLGIAHPIFGFSHATDVVVAIADVFDALTSPRPYKAAWPVEKAIAYIRESSGSHFDPAVVDCFETHFTVFVEIAERYNDAR